MQKVYVNTKLPYMLVDLLEKKFDVVKISEHGDEISFIEDSEILITNGETSVTASLMDKFKSLKLIANFGVGYDKIDVTYAKSKNILITNTPDVLTNDVADLAIAFVFMLSRNLINANKYAKSNKWETDGVFSLSNTIYKKSVGVVGLGRIGKSIADKAFALGMDVSYFARKEDKYGSSRGYKFYGDLLQLARDSDFLILTIPGTKENYHIISEDILNVLGKDSYLINIARGSIVDEKALIDALENNKIKGAALDVFETEPHINEKLLNNDNVITTPHIGSATYETRFAMSKLVYDNIISYLENGKVITPV